MNQRTNNRKAVRLTGRTEVDAGLMKYRELLSERHGTVPTVRGSRASGYSRMKAKLGRNRRRALVVSALVAVFVLLGTLTSAAQVALEFTPGTSGGSGSFALEAYKQATKLSEASGEVVVVAAGLPLPDAPFAQFVHAAPYDGSLDNGSAQLVP